MPNNDFWINPNIEPETPSFATEIVILTVGIANNNTFILNDRFRRSEPREFKLLQYPLFLQA